MNNKKGRSSLIGIVGGYLVYLGWQIFSDRGLEGSLPEVLSILFAVFFALAGVALMVYGYRLWRQADRQDAEEKKDKNALK